jgi:ribosome-associated protein
MSFMESKLSILNQVAQIIYDKKGFNILALDIREISSLCDCVIIAEGNVDRHTSSIAKAIIEELSLKKIDPIHVEGMSQGDWIVIDYLDIIIHIFIPQLREKYQLERLWNRGKIINLKINVGE